MKVNAGSLDIQDPVTLNTSFEASSRDVFFGGASSGTIDGAITDGGFGEALSFTKLDAGSWTLTNTANNFSGVLKVANGTLAVATLNGNGQGAITLGSTTSNESATLRFFGSDVDTNPCRRTIYLAGNATIDASGTPGSLFEVSGNPGVSTTGASGGGNYNYNLALTGSGVGELDGAIATGSGSVTKNGSGMWIFGSPNSYAGGTTINGGTLQATQQDALGQGGLTVNNSGTFDLAGQSENVATLNGSAGGIVTSSTGVSYLHANLNVTGTGSGTFAGTIKDGTDSMADDFPVSLVLSGGQLTLSGSGAYSAGTFVEGGTLIVTNAKAIEDGSDLYVGNYSFPFGTVVTAGESASRTAVQGGGGRRARTGDADAIGRRGAARAARSPTQETSGDCEPTRLPTISNRFACQAHEVGY